MISSQFLATLFLWNDTNYLVALDFSFKKQMVVDEENTSEGHGRANYPLTAHLEDVMPGG